MQFVSDRSARNVSRLEYLLVYCMTQLVSLSITVLVFTSDSDEMKKRMYSNVIVVGGGLMFPGFQSWLHHLLWIHMPANVKSSIEAMDIITRPKVSHLNSLEIFLNGAFLIF